MSEKLEALAPSLEAIRRRPSVLGTLMRFIRTKPLGAAGGLIILIMILVALCAGWLAPYDPYELQYGKRFVPPGREFILGTDNVGRDILSRIIYGTRISLYVGLFATLLGETFGGFLGLVSGYVGGKTDAFMQRIMDIIMSFPGIILALTLVAVLGPSLNNVVIAIAVTEIPRGARVLRSNALSIKENQYVDAARSIGCSGWTILLRHITPQCFAPYMIIATAGLGHAILMEASLSFLGAGTPPPLPSWGGMLSGAGRAYIDTAPWLAIYPGIAISLAVFGFNVLGDALRDILDPRLRGSR